MKRAALFIATMIVILIIAIWFTSCAKKPAITIGDECDMLLGTLCNRVAECGNNNMVPQDCITSAGKTMMHDKCCAEVAQDGYRCYSPAPQ